MENALSGRRVLVTGGTRGIGRGIVLAMARAGASVVTCSRSGGEDAASLEAELKEIGATFRVSTADVARVEDVARLAEECREALGGLDVLVNNAGRDGQAGFAELTAQEWHSLLDADLTSVFLVSQKCLDLFGPSASIVNIGAAVALRGLSGRVHYTAAKAAVIGLTRSMCKELGPRGIRVNVVAPGMIQTDPDEDHPMAARVRGMTALGRFGTVAEVADAVLYLAGAGSSYVTGVVLNVDGGI
jgi:NAD(P)-dependent dehydrogenase (short-subunit alcohol dehydrogenase family)